MTREELEYLVGDAKAASRDKSGWDISRILREAADELERLHRLPGGLLAPAPSPAPAVSFAKQAEAVEREAECRRVSALPGADHWKALSAAAATLRKLAQP